TSSSCRLHCRSSNCLTWATCTSGSSGRSSAGSVSRWSLRCHAARRSPSSARPSPPSTLPDALAYVILSDDQVGTLHEFLREGLPAVEGILGGVRDSRVTDCFWILNTYDHDHRCRTPRPR